MAKTSLQCDHHTYQIDLPDIILHQGVLCGKAGWRWDGKLQPRGINLNGTAYYSSALDDMVCYVRKEINSRKPLVVIEQRPNGGGMFA